MGCPQTITENLCIAQGALFEKVFDVFDADDAPIDLSTRDWRAQVRRSVRSDTILAEWTTGNGMIVVEDAPTNPAGVVLPNGNNARLRIVVGATVTDGYDFSAGQYDLEGELLADPQDVWRMSEGDVEISPQVTRDPSP